MYVGLAIYDVDDLKTKKALNLGERLFKELNLNITGAGYLIKDRFGDPEIEEVSLIDLRNKVDENKATSIRIYSEEESVLPWLASFGYTTSEFEKCCHIDIQYPKNNDNDKIILNFIKELSNSEEFSYGIKYELEGTFEAFHYTLGRNLQNLYSFDKPALFRKDCVIYNKKREQKYKKSMLRMVYEFNILNKDHLKIKIYNKSLKDWILEDSSNGELTKLNDNIWIWEVEKNI